MSLSPLLTLERKKMYEQKKAGALIFTADQRRKTVR